MEAIAEQAGKAENTCGRGPKTYEQRGTVFQSVQHGETSEILQDVTEYLHYNSNSNYITF